MFGKEGAEACTNWPGRFFYHCDIPSLFSKHGELSKHISESSLLVSQEKKKHLSDPLESYRSEDIEKAMHGLQSKYAARHFVDLADKESLYACPRAAGFEPLSSVLLSAAAPAVSGIGIMEDDDDMAQALASAITPTSTTQTVFRVLHKNPAAQKLMASPSSSLRADHVAVAVYKVDSFKTTDVEAPEMTCSADMSCAAHMSLMSIESFLNLTSADLKSKFLKCVESAKTVYSFKPGSLPPHVNQDDANTLAGLMIGADAYPGPYAYYTMSKEDSIGTMLALKHLDYVVAVAGSGWQMTSECMARLSISRHVDSWDHVFKRRSELAFGEMTHWELLDYLAEHGWSLQPLPWRKGVPALQLNKA